MRQYLNVLKGSTKLLPFLFILTFVFNVQAQGGVKHGNELGFALGISNYTGDLSEKYSVNGLGPAGQLFYKFNIPGEVSVLRLNLLYATLQADELNIDKPLQQSRGESFELGVLEAAAIYEYNFYNFRDLKGVYYMSPYLFGGIGSTITLGGDEGNYFSLPLGVGLKMMISRHLNFGFEFGSRLTFSDRIDGVDDNILFSSSSNNDWYYFYGLTLSYTWYKQICKGR